MIENEIKSIHIEKEYQPDSHWRKKIIPRDFECHKCLLGNCIWNHRLRKSRKPRKTRKNCTRCLAGLNCPIHNY